MSKEYLELEERYNMEGICVERKINGVPLPTNEHPSVVFTGEDIKNAKWVKTTSFMTPQQAQAKYGYNK